MLMPVFVLCETVIKYLHTYETDANGCNVLLLRKGVLLFNNCVTLSDCRMYYITSKSRNKERERENLKTGSLTYRPNLNHGDCRLYRLLFVCMDHVVGVRLTAMCFSFEFKICGSILQRIQYIVIVGGIFYAPRTPTKCMC